jgi:hypothetical protein
VVTCLATRRHLAPWIIGSTFPPHLIKRANPPRPSGSLESATPAARGNGRQIHNVLIGRAPAR